MTDPDGQSALSSSCAPRVSPSTVTSAKCGTGETPPRAQPLLALWAMFVREQPQDFERAVVRRGRKGGERGGRELHVDDRHVLALLEQPHEPPARRTVVQGRLVERDQVQQLERLDELQPPDLARGD